MPVKLPKQDAPLQPVSPAQPVAWSLAAAERDTGLSRDTLLDWERRYGFPLPTPDASGRRQYTAEQIQRLRSIRQALETGHAPDELLSATPDALARLAATARPGPDTGPIVSEPLGLRREAVDLLARNEVAGLRRLLLRAMGQWGVGRFVCELVAPLSVDVGDAWMQGRLEVFQEHLYTEAAQGLLRHALHELPAAAGPGCPVVLLTTSSGEGHGLGLLMAEAVLRLEGCCCHSLGVQTPPWEVVRAAAALDVDVVALSYTGAAEPGSVVGDLTELRRKLPATVELWAGGSAAVLRRYTIDGLRVVPDLGQVAAAVSAWHARQGPVPAGPGTSP